MRFTVALDGYWLAKRRNMSHHTYLDYDLTFRRFADFINDGEVESITSTEINRFLNHVKETHSLAPKTMSNVWTALSSFFTWASVELKLPHPMRGSIKRPQYRRQPVEAYTEAEIKAMLASCEYAMGYDSRRGRRIKTRRPTGLRDKAILIVLLDTGIRAAELCALTIADYEQPSGKLTIRHGKGNKRRYVFLGQSARQAVWRYLATRKRQRPNDPLFATRTGTPIDRYALLNMVSRTAARAGVTGANVHKFRHTFAITFLRNGGNVLQLQKLLGHERMETLRIYVDLAQGDLAQAQAIASPADNWGL